MDQLVTNVCWICGRRLMQPRGEEDPPAPAPRLRISPARLRRATQFIESNLGRNVRLADIAGAAGMSVFHFARSFRAETGLPPYRYLMLRRVERAKLLIATTDEPLGQIAIACGFQNQSRMTEAFRRVVDCTPAQWRRTARG